MVKHMVMWRMKPDVTEAQMMEMKALLEGLIGKVESLLEIEVGVDYQRNEASSDLCLSSLFNDEAGVKTYATHPEHLKVVAVVKPWIAERRVVDFHC